MSNNADPSTTKTAGTNAEQKPIVPNNAPNGHPTVKSSLIAEVMFTLLILFLGVQLMYLYYKHTAPFGPRQSELESVGITTEFVEQLKRKKQECLSVSEVKHCKIPVVVDIIIPNKNVETAANTGTK